MAITVVQTKTNTGTTGTTLTVTITATTAGNSLIACSGAYSSVSSNPISGVTAGGNNLTSGISWQDLSGLVAAEIWYLDNIPSGITSVVITYGGANTDIAAVVYEVSGLKASGSADFGSNQDIDSSSSPVSWTSGTTLTLSQASEIAVGITAQAAAITTITGPSAPWVNTNVTSVALKIAAGTNILNSVTGLAYAGSTTFTGTADTATVILAFKAAVSGGSPDVPAITPGPTWLKFFKPWIPRPAPLTQPPFVAMVTTSGSVAMAPLTVMQATAYLKTSDLPAIRPGNLWLSLFKPGQRPRPPLAAAPPSGPNPANLPNFSDVPGISPGPTWQMNFKPGMPRPHPLVPVPFNSVMNPGSVAMAPPAMTGTVTIYPAASGSVALAAAKMTGTVKVPVIANASMAMAPMAASGTVHVPVIVNASVAMAPMKIRTPNTLADLPAIAPGPMWLEHYKPGLPKTIKMPGGPQYIGARDKMVLAPAAMSGQVIQYLPFPQFPLNLKIEILINGTWLDITQYAYQRNGLSITRGLPDETQAAQPSQCTMTLNNRDGRFSPNNTAGAYYPYLTRNTQLRVSVVNQASSSGVPYSGYRFWGEVSAFPPRWDPSQTDVYCDITVSGVLRRYVQAAPLGSTLKQYYTSLTGPQAPYGYWPCEDGSKATEIASALPLVAAATFTGAPQFASDAIFGGSDPIPVIASSVWHGVTAAAANPPGTGSITQKSPGTYFFTAPPGVTAVTSVSCLGAGGGGGDQNTTIGGGGGGGGGNGTSASVSVTAGTKYTYIVGAGGTAGAGGTGGTGSASTWTGDTQTITGSPGAGGSFGGNGGAGGSGATFAGGNGAAGQTAGTSIQGDSIQGNSGAAAAGDVAGGQQSTSWTAPAGVTSVNVFAQGAGGGGAGGGFFAFGGPGGGGGGGSNGSLSVTPGSTYTVTAGNGGGGGTGSFTGIADAGGGPGGDSVFTGDSGEVRGHAGGGGIANNSDHSQAGGGGGGGSPGGNGGNGSFFSGHGGGGGGGDSGENGGTLGQSGNLRTPGGSTGAGAGGGWGASNAGNIAGSTGGGTAGQSGGGGGGGGSIDGSHGRFGGGGGPGFVDWNWAVTGTPSAGGGGSSAGSSTGGNDGSNSTGGSAPAGGGAGGNAGNPGGLPGGGGGGAIPDTGSGVTPAGAGAPGQVSFSWSGGATSPVAADIIRFCLHVNSAGAADGAIVAQVITYGTVATMNLIYHTGGHLELVGINSSSVTVFDSGSIAFTADGTPLYISLELTGSGSNVNWTLAGIKPGSLTLAASASGTVAGQVGNVSDVFIDPGGTIIDSGTSLGQITVQTYADTLVNLSPIVNGYAGELAATRISRLCASQNIGFTLTGSASDTPAMGPQADSTFVSLLQACADLDRGQLFETRSSFGIGYRTRVNLQGQTPVLTADYRAATLAGSLQPTADDQFTRNQITVTRQGGASSAVQLASGTMSVLTPPLGVGVYSYNLTVDAFSDTQLPNLAAWMLTVGTVSEYRYPGIEFDMARQEVRNLFGIIPSLDIGDYIQVVNPPFFLQSLPIAQLAWGFTETLNAYTWTITINTVPESPYAQGNPPTW